MMDMDTGLGRAAHVPPETISVSQRGYVKGTNLAVGRLLRNLELRFRGVPVT